MEKLKKKDGNASLIANSFLLKEDEKIFFITANRSSKCLDKRRGERPQKTVHDIIASMNVFFEKAKIIYNEKKLPRIAGRLEEIVGFSGESIDGALADFIVAMAKLTHKQLGIFIAEYARQCKWIGVYSNNVTFFNAVPDPALFKDGDHERFRKIAEKTRKQANCLLRQARQFETLYKKVR